MFGKTILDLVAANVAKQRGAEEVHISLSIEKRDYDALNSAVNTGACEYRNIHDVIRLAISRHAKYLANIRGRDPQSYASLDPTTFVDEDVYGQEDE